MKYRTFLLSDQEVNGKKVTKKIIFNPDLIGKRMTDEERLERSFKLLEDSGGIDGDKNIIEVNPEKFARFKYKAIVDSDVLMPRNEAFERAFKLDAYDRMITNPFVDQKAVTREFLVEPLAKGESDKFMPDKAETPISAIMKQLGVDVGTTPGQGSNLVNQATEPGLKQMLQNNA